MQVDWYGQSTFRLSNGDMTVAIDPFGDMSMAGDRWRYPAIKGLEADLVLVTHEHADHNGVEVVGGDPLILRSTAGTHESPVGEVIGIASEHDDVAGTQRGPNTIFAFTLGDVRIAHFGDFGQDALRDEQAAALGQIDLLFIPVGDGPTIGAARAVAIAEQAAAKWIVPMHYRTERISFLEPIDELLGHYDSIERLETPGFALADLPKVDSPLLVVPAAP